MLNKFTPQKCLKTLVISNITIFIVLIVVLYKSQYYKKVLQKMNVIEMTEQVSPDYWAIYGWTNTLQKIHYDADIAFFGNSITCFSDFQTYFPKKKIANLGYPSDTMKGMMKRTNQLSAVTPEKIFIMAGINGIDGMTLTEFALQYNNLLDSVHEAVPNAYIYVQSILPIDTVRYPKRSVAKIKNANKLLKSICKKRHLQYINLFDLYVKNDMMNPELTIDGVHLCPNAYDRWAKAIDQYIQ